MPLDAPVMKTIPLDMGLLSLRMGGTLAVPTARVEGPQPGVSFSARARISWEAMFRPSLRRSSISLVVALSALTAAGCAATGAAPFLAFALSLGLVLFGAACAESHETRL